MGTGEDELGDCLGVIHLLCRQTGTLKADPGGTRRDGFTVWLPCGFGKEKQRDASGTLKV